MWTHEVLGLFGTEKLLATYQHFLMPVDKSLALFFSLSQPGTMLAILTATLIRYIDIHNYEHLKVWCIDVKFVFKLNVIDMEIIWIFVTLIARKFESTTEFSYHQCLLSMNRNSVTIDVC